MGLSLQQAKELEEARGGTTSFFNLKPGEEANIRILYNKSSDIEIFSVHEFGQEYKYATVKCPIESKDDSLDSCKYCAQGLRPVMRAIIPVYNENKQQIEYWKRSRSWIEKYLVPYTDEVEKAGHNICSQVYKVKRSGEGLDTNYSLIPTGPIVDTDKDSFGKIGNPETELKMIKPANTDVQPTQNSGDANNNTQFTPRRTADVF